jgi:hypothetical protein
MSVSNADKNLLLSESPAEDHGVHYGTCILGYWDIKNME